MGNRLLVGVTVAALSLAAVPAGAQISLRSDVAWAGSRNAAFDEGFRAGEREGAHDGRERKDYGFKRDDEYEDADRGYHRGFGSKDAYRHEFRRGYEVGYDRGYRRFGYVYQGGSANEYGPYGYPDRGYGPYGYPERGYGGYAEPGYRGSDVTIRFAFDYGRREGYAAGIEAARYGRYEPMRHRYYRSTRGWERRYGSRDAYDVNYRNGFRNGYEEGYNDARRTGRW